MTEKPADRQAALLAKLDLSSSTINYRPPVVASLDEPVFTSPVTVENNIKSKHLQRPGMLFINFISSVTV